jgi:hypothetical protein
VHRNFLFSIRRQTNRKGNPMRAAKLLHDLLDDASKSVDKRLRKILYETVESLIICKQLTIAGLGRSLNRKAKIKHNIKCIDRLFGNSALQNKRKVFYKGMAKHLLKGNQNPLVVVDWSGLTPCGAYYFLRASVTTNGRALTLYEEVHPLREYMKEATHLAFLKNLYCILEENCKPIILTDAGFRNTWFKTVLALGWDFIGRVRNRTKYCEDNQRQWKPIKNLYGQATLKPTYLGQVRLSRSSQLKCHFYLMKQKKKNRIKRNLAGKKIQCSVSKKHECRENEPWLIASSLWSANISAEKVISWYKKRMQIEEAFRDLKNTRNGFGLRHCRSFQIGRLNIALLVAAIAMLVLWIFGCAVKNKNLHYSFQSNTEKKRNVLSNFTIGWQGLVLQNFIKFSKKELVNALHLINLSAR